MDHSILMSALIHILHFKDEINSLPHISSLKNAMVISWASSNSDLVLTMPLRGLLTRETYSIEYHILQFYVKV